MTNFQFFSSLDCNKNGRGCSRYVFTWETKSGKIKRAWSNEGFRWDEITDARYYVLEGGKRPAVSPTDCRKWLESNSRVIE